MDHKEFIHFVGLGLCRSWYCRSRKVWPLFCCNATSCKKWTLRSVNLWQMLFVEFLVMVEVVQCLDHLYLTTVRCVDVHNLCFGTFFTWCCLYVATCCLPPFFLNKYSIEIRKRLVLYYNVGFKYDTRILLENWTTWVGYSDKDKGGEFSVHEESSLILHVPLNSLLKKKVF